MDTNETPNRSSIRAGVDRRTIVSLGGLALLCGCVADGSRTLPGPIWPDLDESCPIPPAPPTASGGRATPSPLPAGGVLPRSDWARGAPICSLMNPMLPVKYVTVHHDGMTPFTAEDQRSSAGRIEMIRNGHRGNGWGDIGYHYVIDRDGRVWEGRAINYQGAHVKNCNEGNLGICCLGNFDEQSPSAAQMAALERQLKLLMRTYGVPKSRVKTHQEWAGAKTACPGRSLQASMVKLRRSSALA
ncbi:MAG: N-acetylmuramoyl-L-alanine amidase [Phycisphaerae bacterium]|nr:N-acetylmuramoyl-L-alanine amidase [Phycisphaerae bacterium]